MTYYYRASDGDPLTQPITVKISEEDYYSGVSRGLIEVRDWLNGLIEQVPTEHRDEAILTLKAWGADDFDSGQIEVSVTYERHETPEEVSQRVARALVFERQVANEREQQERATLEALKAKYG